MADAHTAAAGEAPRQHWFWSVAKRFWPNTSALGKRLQMGLAVEDQWLTVVGVVADVRHDGLAVPSPEMVYLPVVGKGGPAGWIPTSTGRRSSPRRSGTTSASASA